MLMMPGNRVPPHAIHVAGVMLPWYADMGLNVPSKACSDMPGALTHSVLPPCGCTGFRHEKTKAKRGGGKWRGGAIDTMGSNSIKFD